MDSTPISKWQQEASVQDASPDLGLIAQLYVGTRDTFSMVLELMSMDETKTSSVCYDNLRKQFGKYFLWYEGFSQVPGGLDQLLLNSQALRATVLRLMVLWGQCVQRSKSAVELPNVAIWKVS